VAGIPFLNKLDVQFPDPNQALDEPDGLLAAGGDLTPEWLLTAYSFGIFPWFNSDEEPIYWWSPKTRGVLQPGHMRITRSLRKRIQNGSFSITTDEQFDAVIECCATTPRNDQAGTWITPRMQSAYHALFQRGVAHSVEVWNDNALVGGLYGIALGQMFFGESMFSKVPDASKVAFYHLQQYLLAENFSLIDCQMMNPHLETLGIRPMERAEFLARLGTNRDKATKIGPWSWAQTLPETQTITDHNQQPQIKVDTGQ
jgi:leucyl/phenylalanyl-tRNA--protein transferase